MQIMVRADHRVADPAEHEADADKATNTTAAVAALANVAGKL